MIPQLLNLFTHVNECVCVWVTENSPPHLCLWVRKRTHLPSALPSNHTLDNLLANRILDGQTDGHTRFSAETLNPDTPKRIPITLSDTHYGHTQEDTHYTEWYPLRTHPRGYPLHLVIPIMDTPKRIPITMMIPITDTPKRIPITLSDTHYGHTQENTHYTEWYPLWTHPRRYPLHWVIPITDTLKKIPITLSDTHYGHTQEDTHYHTEWYPLHWVGIHGTAYLGRSG